MDAEEQDMMRRKDDYEAGKRATQIQFLIDGMGDIKEALSEHRGEEKETWKGFQERQAAMEKVMHEKLEAMEEAINELKLWRAKMMGVAGVIAFFVTSATHILYTFIKR